MEEDINLSQEMGPTSIPKGGLSPWHGGVAHGPAVISGLIPVQLWLGAPVWSPQPGAFFAAFLCSILLITVFHNCDSDFHSWHLDVHKSKTFLRTAFFSRHRLICGNYTIGRCGSSIYFYFYHFHVFCGKESNSSSPQHPKIGTTLF